MLNFFIIELFYFNYISNYYSDYYLSLVINLYLLGNYIFIFYSLSSINEFIYPFFIGKLSSAYYITLDLKIPYFCGRLSIEPLRSRLGGLNEGMCLLSLGICKVFGLLGMLGFINCILFRDCSLESVSITLDVKIPGFCGRLSSEFLRLIDGLFDIVGLRSFLDYSD